MTEQRDEVIIRGARPTDATAIAQIRVAAWRAGYRAFVPDSYLDRPDWEGVEARHLHTMLRDLTATARVSVAEYRSQIVGYCAYGVISADDPMPSTGGVYDVFVHPDYWGRGVGRKLLTCATEYLRNAGCDAVSLWVFEANTRARTFYEAAGWEADGQRAIDERPAFALPVVRYRKVLPALGTNTDSSAA